MIYFPLVKIYFRDKIGEFYPTNTEFLILTKADAEYSLFQVDVGFGLDLKLDLSWKVFRN
jgi:hypothetical protein